MFQKCWKSKRVGYWNVVFVLRKASCCICALKLYNHGSFAKYLFIGSEIEVLRSPYTNNGTLSLANPKWVPTLLLGGGFSGMIGDSFRVNAGVMYDILDIPNPPTKYPDSPLQPYVARNKTTGVVIPIIYRIAFFIPLS